MELFPNKLERLPRQLILVRELEAFEGPILSELKADGGGLYVEKWCALDAETERTLIVRSEARAIAEYMAGRMTMLELLTVPSDGVGFLVDRKEGHVTDIFLVSVLTLPANYLPKPEARHDESLRPEWETAPQTFLLGANWNAKMLADIERRYLDVAGFGYFTEPGQHRELPHGIVDITFDGGFPYMHTFNRIRSAIPGSVRPRSSGVSANSPGVLTIDAPRAIAAHLFKALQGVPASANAYDAVHVWSRLKPEKVSKVPATALDDLKRLSGRLHVDVSALLPPPANDFNPAMGLLVAGKLLTAYYRKLWVLLEADPDVEFLDAANIGRESDDDRIIDDDEDDDEPY